MKQIVYSIIIALTFSSCSTKISSRSDSKIDISKSKTFSFYGWTEVNDLVEVDRIAIEKAVKVELQKRQLTYKETGGDLIFSFFLVIDKGSTTNRYNTYYGHGPYGFYQPSWGWGMGYGSTWMSNSGVPYPDNHFLKGTLVVDVFDINTKKLAWQGVVSKAIDSDNNTKNKNRSANRSKLAKKMMKDFPIKEVEK